jgi:hypothetical protein
MIQFRDKETGAALGEMTEAQLQFLIDNLEEESSEDTDYYLNPTMLEMLQEKNADPDLMALLRAALGDREEMEIEWNRR